MILSTLTKEKVALSHRLVKSNAYLDPTGNPKTFTELSTHTTAAQTGSVTQQSLLSTTLCTRH